MINNRQNGRRRGRGGGPGAPRPNGSNGGQDRGNRIDNRARGNAAQLLEKYKALARDAQMQGDRVNTEYYLQFADHYFRVLSETRARFEDQQPRPRRDDFSQQSDEDYADEGDRIGGDERQQAPEPAYDPRDRAPRADYARNRDDQPRERDPRAEREPRGDREARVEREPRAERQPRAEREAREPRVERQPRVEREQQAEEASVDQAEERRPRRGRPPRIERSVEDAEPAAPAVQPVLFDAPSEEEEARPVRRRGRPPKAQAVEQIEADRLPPSLSLSTPDNDCDEPTERPRRTRKPRGESAAA